MYLIYKGSKVYFTARGKGRPILFLHGWGGSVDSFKAVEDCFLDKHFCINLDFPPFGKSEEPKSPYNMQDYLEIVKRILTKLEIKKTSVVAHSFGGRVAIMLATSTNFVDKLVLTAAAGIKPKITLKKMFKKVKYRLAKLLVRIGLKKKESLLLYGSEDFRKLNPTMRETFKNILNLNLVNMLEYIQVPTMLFWGTKDRQTPFYMAKTMEKKIKDCCLFSYKGCGHFCYLEKFYEFKTITRAFLN